jgi:hypothetical protein
MTDGAGAQLQRIYGIYSISRLLGASYLHSLLGRVVRRGELFVLDSDRMLPNVYYMNVAQNVAHALKALKIDYQLELHTEVPKKEFIVQPDHHGISNRISAATTVNPEMCRIDEFSVLPNLIRCINEPALDCLRKLATADILVMSRSSFSYLGGILNRNGIILYYPFWHRAPSSWMTVGPKGQFDQLKFRKAVKNLRERVRTP